MEADSMIEVYPSVVQESPGVYLLSAPRGMPDGIGCALVIGVRELGASPMTLEWERLEHWGEDAWRSLWLWFSDVGNPYPAFYVIPKVAGIEWGRSLGPQPEDQRIQGTISIPLGTVSLAVLSVLNEALHVSVGVGKLGGDLLASFPLAVIGLQAPTLGLYCEASVVKVKVRSG